MEPGTDLGKFPSRQVNALLLDLGALLLRLGAQLLRVGALLQRFQFSRHLLHGMSQFGQLPGDARYVLIRCDAAEILRPGEKGSRVDGLALCARAPAETRADVNAPSARDEREFRRTEFDVQGQFPRSCDAPTSGGRSVAQA